MRKRLVYFIRKWGQSVFAIVLGGLIIFYMLIIFNMKTENTVEELIHSNMEEMNQAAILSLNNSFKSFIEALQLEADIFSMMQSQNDAEIMSKLAGFAEEGGYKNVAIVTYDGRVYSTFRGVTKVTKADRLPNLLKRETTVSQPRVFHDGTLVIDISTPLYLNGNELGKLVVSIGSDYIAEMFSNNILKGDASLNLITQDGMVITRISKRPSLLVPRSNIFNFYSGKEVQFVKGSVASLTSDMADKKSVWIEYNYSNSPVCVSYLPFGRNDWYMAIAATDGTLREQSGMIQRDALILTLGIMLIVILASFIVVIQRINEQKRIDTLKNTYSIAIKKTNDLFYEADMDNDMFIDYSEQKDKTIWKEAPKNYSNALIQVAEICAPECRQQFLDTFLPQNIKIKMKEGISSINFEYKITPDESTVRWLSAIFVPVNDGIGGTKLICMENDITERMLKQESLKRSATLDGLTGIYNRETTKNYINWFLENEGADGIHALALMDIDYFKQVNDHLGHAKGDDVLIEFSCFLKKIFRKSDIVGRVGGDEFVVLLKDYSVVELVVAKMNAVLESFNKEHFLSDDKSDIVRTSASIGIAIFDKNGSSFDALYQAADIAMYESKRGGRDRFTFFRDDMREKINDACDAIEIIEE